MRGLRGRQSARLLSWLMREWDDLPGRVEEDIYAASNPLSRYDPNTRVTMRIDLLLLSSRAIPIALKVGIPRNLNGYAFYNAEKPKSPPGRYELHI